MYWLVTLPADLDIVSSIPPMTNYLMTISVLSAWGYLSIIKTSCSVYQHSGYQWDVVVALPSLGPDCICDEVESTKSLTIGDLLTYQGFKKNCLLHSDIFIF